MLSKIIYRTLTAALLVLLSLQGLADEAASQSLPQGIITLDGREATAVTLKDLDGNSFDLSAQLGKWTFLHFWASWCGPCRKEMPTIQSIWSEFQGTELAIVLVNTAEDEDTVFNFMGIVAPDMNTLLDSDGKVTERWQPRGLPSTFFIDPEGKLRYLALGGRPWDKGEYLAFLKGLIKK